MTWGRGKLLRRLGILLVFSAALSLGWLAFKSTKNQAPLAVSSLISGILLITFLLWDSFATFWYFLGFSKRNSLYLICCVDSRFDTNIKILKDKMRTAPEKDLEIICEHGTQSTMSDYETRQPIRRLLALLLGRNISNLLITIATFSIVIISLGVWHNAAGGGTVNPYQHDCRLDRNTYISQLLHSFYYQSVIFQSLGDGNHVPTTALAQTLATGEAYIAMCYVALLLGGSLSVAIYAGSVLTENVVRNELRRALLPVWASRVPITDADDARIKTI